MLADNSYDVVISGGGPVGHGLAIELGQRGVSVLVIERSSVLHQIPRGQNLTQRTVEHFHAWRCESELRAARTVPRGHGIGGLVTYGSLLSPWHYDWLQRELVRPYYLTDNERLPQYETERVLRERAAQLPNVTCVYGQKAVDLKQDETGVTVEYQDAEDGSTTTARAEWLVGCDGSRSMVREAAGITVTRRDHDKKMVLLVFRSTALHDLLQRYPDKQFYNALHPDLKGYWMFLGRVDLGSTWFFHAPVPMDTTADNFDFAAYLHRAVGEEFELDIEHIGFWDLRFSVANNYRAGRVLIAGDAAHSHPPYGGYGINTGFEDVRNLGWKLSATIHGWGGPHLLESYNAERQPVFASTSREFIENFINEDRDFLDNHAPDKDLAAFEKAWAARAEGALEVHSFEPNYEGSPIVPGTDGTPSAKGSHVFVARAGHHLTPRMLSNGKSVFGQLGEGFTLLAVDGSDGDVECFEAAAARLAVPVKVFRDNSNDGRSDWESRYILVRPDEYVAWAGNEMPDPEAVLRASAGF